MVRKVGLIEDWLIWFNATLFHHICNCPRALIKKNRSRVMLERLVRRIWSVLLWGRSMTNWLAIFSTATFQVADDSLHWSNTFLQELYFTSHTSCHLNGLGCSTVNVFYVLLDAQNALGEMIQNQSDLFNDISCLTGHCNTTKMNTSHTRII